MLHALVLAGVGLVVLVVLGYALIGGLIGLVFRRKLEQPEPPKKPF